MWQRYYSVDVFNMKRNVCFFFKDFCHFFCIDHYIKMILQLSWLATLNEHKWQKRKRQEGTKQELFSTSGYGQKENAFPISAKENSKYICNAVFSFVNTTHCNFTLKRIVEHFSVWKLNTTICHLQIKENAILCIGFFLYEIKMLNIRCMHEDKIYIF